MTPQTLSDIKSRMPGCALAVWADLASGTVLAGTGDLDYPQEYLDALGACAIAVLGVPDPLDAAPVDAAVIFGPTCSYAFHRNPDAADEALCFLCAPASDAEALVASVKAALVSGVANLDNAA
ncbi:MAG: hypothetical protein AAF376_07675 [Pseudomonadota bacterium]